MRPTDCGRGGLFRGFSESVGSQRIGMKIVNDIPNWSFLYVFSHSLTIPDISFCHFRYLLLSFPISPSVISDVSFCHFRFSLSVIPDIFNRESSQRRNPGFCSRRTRTHGRAEEKNLDPRSGRG